jgi:2-keto-4-pentenoate hydratase/2-oxohepta-3-ene-1,7-dioic acid hydratase in catechol pathway
VASTGRWEPPCPRPTCSFWRRSRGPRKNIFGIGLNYAEHVEESSRSLDTAKEMPDQPVIFSKPPTAVIGPGEPVQHNAALTQQLDWEVELAVIIGTRAHRVAEADAMAHVWGYSVMIDISARDNRRAGQWIYSKGMDSYAPFGPCIVTATR